MNNFVPAFSIFVMLSIYLVHVLSVRSIKNRFSKILSQITLAGTVSAVSYCVFMMLTNYLRAFLAITVYCIAIDWLVYFVFVYVLILTQAGPQLTVLRIPFKILFVLDTFDLLFNCYFHHRFDLQPELSDTAFKNFTGTYTLWNQVSNIISYGITLLTLGILIYYTVKANIFVRKRYLWVLTGYSLVLLVNIISVALNLPLDFSIALYFLGAMTLAYGTRKVLPKPVMRDANELLLQNIKMMVMFFDRDGHCMFANKQADDFLGMSDETGYQKADVVFKEIYNAEDEKDTLLNEAVKEKYTQVDENHQPSEYKTEEIRLESVEGKPYVRRFLWPLKNKSQRMVGYCLVLEDITEEKKKAEKEAYDADHDALTELYNRDAFLRVGKKFLGARSRWLVNPVESYNMISVNILNFKRININFTTKGGDRLLQQMAFAINLAVWGENSNEESETDSYVEDSQLQAEESLIGRMGADRFAFILRKDKNTKAVIDRITEIVRKSFEKYNYRLEIVFGICPISPEMSGKDWELNLFYDNAVRAAQTIQPGDKANFAYYDKDLEKKIEEEQSLVDAFENAINEHQFLVYIQPQYDTHKMTHGGEALVRWNHPTKGFLPPLSFLGPIKEAGLMHRLDIYVWEEVVRLLRRWDDEGKKEIYLSTNIDPTDFYHIDVHEVISKLAAKYKISHGRLRLEITEAAIKDNQEAERVYETLRKLRADGYTIELDDFGSEYSSLNRLKDIPADVLKMDMKFLEDTVNTEKRKAITDSIIYLGNRLKMTVIAEGVETVEQFDELASIGCQKFQGYYFDKPMPVNEFEKLMQDIKGE